MITVEEVRAIVMEHLEQTDAFLVDVKVLVGNSIVVEVDRNEGVDIDLCVALSRFIESRLDREVEDYELEVGSAGVTSPFKVREQYVKNIGREVEVLASDGKKYTGELAEADQDCFSIVRGVKKLVEGSKRKQMVEEKVTFAYSEVKYCRVDLKV